MCCVSETFLVGKHFGETFMCTYWREATLLLLVSKGKQDQKFVSVAKVLRRQGATTDMWSFHGTVD